MGKLKKPASPLDVALKLLQEKGAAHERAYVQHLRAKGLTIVEIPDDAESDERISETVAALKSGADVICQGAFAGSTRSRTPRTASSKLTDAAGTSAVG